MCVADTTATNAMADDSRKVRLYLSELLHKLNAKSARSRKQIRILHALDEAEGGAAAGGGRQRQKLESGVGNCSICCGNFVDKRHVAHVLLFEREFLVEA
jgi:hypothetical protein